MDVRRSQLAGEADYGGHGGFAGKPAPTGCCVAVDVRRSQLAGEAGVVTGALGERRIDHRAPDVADEDVTFLDAGGVVRGDDEGVIAEAV